MAEYALPDLLRGSGMSEEEVRLVMLSMAQGQQQQPPAAASATRPHVHPQLQAPSESYAAPQRVGAGTPVSVPMGAAAIGSGYDPTHEATRAGPPPPAQEPARLLDHRTGYPSLHSYAHINPGGAAVPAYAPAPDPPLPTAHVDPDRNGRCSRNTDASGTISSLSSSHTPRGGGGGGGFAGGLLPDDADALDELERALPAQRLDLEDGGPLELRRQLYQTRASPTATAPASPGPISGILRAPSLGAAATGGRSGAHGVGSVAVDGGGEEIVLLNRALPQQPPPTLRSSTNSTPLQGASALPTPLARSQSVTFQLDEGDDDDGADADGNGRGGGPALTSPPRPPVWRPPRLDANTRGDVPPVAHPHPQPDFGGSPLPAPHILPDVASLRPPECPPPAPVPLTADGGGVGSIARVPAGGYEDAAHGVDIDAAGGLVYESGGILKYGVGAADQPTPATLQEMMFRDFDDFEVIERKVADEAQRLLQQANALTGAVRAPSAPPAAAAGASPGGAGGESPAAAAAASPPRGGMFARDFDAHAHARTMTASAAVAAALADFGSPSPTVFAAAPRSPVQASPPAPLEGAGDGSLRRGLAARTPPLPVDLATPKAASPPRVASPQSRDAVVDAPVFTAGPTTRRGVTSSLLEADTSIWRDRVGQNEAASPPPAVASPQTTRSPSHPQQRASPSPQRAREGRHCYAPRGASLSQPLPPRRGPTPGCTIDGGAAGDAGGTPVRVQSVSRAGAGDARDVAATPPRVEASPPRAGGRGEGGDTSPAAAAAAAAATTASESPSTKALHELQDLLVKHQQQRRRHEAEAEAQVEAKPEARDVSPLRQRPPTTEPQAPPTDPDALLQHMYAQYLAAQTDAAAGAAGTAVDVDTDDTLCARRPTPSPSDASTCYSVVRARNAGRVGGSGNVHIPPLDLPDRSGGGLLRSVSPGGARAVSHSPSDVSTCHSFNIAQQRNAVAHVGGGGGGMLTARRRSVSSNVPPAHTLSRARSASPAPMPIATPSAASPPSTLQLQVPAPTRFAGTRSATPNPTAVPPPPPQYQRALPTRTTPTPTPCDVMPMGGGDVRRSPSADPSVGGMSVSGRRRSMTPNPMSDAGPLSGRGLRTPGATPALEVPGLNLNRPNLQQQQVPRAASASASPSQVSSGLPPPPPQYPGHHQANPQPIRTPLAPPAAAPVASSMRLPPVASTAVGFGGRTALPLPPPEVLSQLQNGPVHQGGGTAGARGSYSVAASVSDAASTSLPSVIGGMRADDPLAAPERQHLCARFKHTFAAHYTQSFGAAASLVEKADPLFWEVFAGEWMEALPNFRGEAAALG